MSDFDLGAWLDEQAAVTSNIDAEPTVYDPAKFITVRKMVAYLPISDEVLHPERYPSPKVRWWTRLRWRISTYQDRLALAWEALSGRHDCSDYY